MIPFCILLKLFASLTLLYKKSTIGYYLIISIFLEIIYNILNYLMLGYSKPYIGYAFILFVIKTILYLGQGSLFLWFAGKIINNKTITQIAPISLVSIMLFITTSYPIISGRPMLKVFYIYYFICFISSLIVMFIQFKKLTIDKLFILMLSLGGLSEIFILYFVGNYYYLVQLSNCIFYIVLILFYWIIRKYIHLLL